MTRYMRTAPRRSFSVRAYSTWWLSHASSTYTSRSAWPAVATFGKKISQAQIYKLQTKGVRNVVVGYDGDAVDATKKTAEELSRYFEVLVADIPDPKKDWEDLSPQEIYDIFAYRLKTPVEYKINKIQQL